MANWRDVMDARSTADRYESQVNEDAGLTRDEALLSALLAIKAELRAFATLFDFARGDAR